jgi:hypothetical protein
LHAVSEHDQPVNLVGKDLMGIARVELLEHLKGGVGERPGDPDLPQCTVILVHVGIALPQSEK